MWSYSTDVLLRKGGAVQCLASLANDAPGEIYVLIRNVGEASAELTALNGPTGPLTLEPHSSRLVVLTKGGAVSAKPPTDNYTVLQVQVALEVPA